MSFPSSSFLPHRIPRPLAGALVAVVFSAGGCPRRAPSAPPSTIAIDEAARRLEPIRRQALGVARYQAVARVRGRGPEGRFSATLLLAFERPERLRVELLGPFGSARWIAVVEGGVITVLFPSRREFLREGAVPEVLDALVGVRWGLEEVVAVLSGAGVPLDQTTPTAALEEGATVRVDLAAGLFLRLKGDQVVEANTVDYSVRYPTAWRSKGRAAPDRIELQSDDMSAGLTVSNLDINVPLHVEVFRLEIPQGTSRVRLGEIGGEAFLVKSER